MYVPENVVGNEDLTKIMDTSDDWIVELSLIHISEPTRPY